MNDEICIKETKTNLSFIQLKSPFPIPLTHEAQHLQGCSSPTHTKGGEQILFNYFLAQNSQKTKKPT